MSFTAIVRRPGSKGVTDSLKPAARTRNVCRPGVNFESDNLPAGSVVPRLTSSIHTIEFGSVVTD
jgi:hypothetical protein